MPCGGDQFEGTATQATSRWAFEWDDNGNETHALQTDLAGNTLLETTGRYIGTERVLMTREIPGSVSERWTADTIDARVERVTFTDNLGDGDYGETWTWNGDALAMLMRDYTSDRYYDRTETYEGSGGGFRVHACDVGATFCNGFEYNSADFVGDFHHWTRVDDDYHEDGSIDARQERSFDSHDLILTYDVSAADTSGNLVLSSHALHTRDSDGTPTRFDFESFGTSPRTYHVVYDFECN